MPEDPVPRLETARTVMRGWRQSDLDAVAEWYADPEVTRWVGSVADREEAWRRLAIHAGHWLLRGYGLWAVERREDRVLLGRVGIWQPEGWFGLELGWTLGRQAWGHGYATEAARAAMQWAWSALETPRLISVIRPDNSRSIAVAERLGMRPAGHDLYREEPVVIYAIERPG